MLHLLTSDESVQEAVSIAVRAVLVEILPDLVRRATRKPYLTSDEVEELTGFRPHKLRYLRQKRQLTFVQNGRKILYPTDDLFRFLKDRHITPRVPNPAKDRFSREVGA